MTEFQPFMASPQRDPAQTLTVNPYGTDALGASGRVADIREGLAALGPKYHTLALAPGSHGQAQGFTILDLVKSGTADRPFHITSADVRDRAILDLGAADYSKRLSPTANPDWNTWRARILNLAARFHWFTELEVRHVTHFLYSLYGHIGVHRCRIDWTLADAITVKKETNEGNILITENEFYRVGPPSPDPEDPAILPGGMSHSWYAFIRTQAGAHGAYIASNRAGAVANVLVARNFFRWISGAMVHLNAGGVRDALRATWVEDNVGYNVREGVTNYTQTQGVTTRRNVVVFPSNGPVDKAGLQGFQARRGGAPIHLRDARDSVATDNLFLSFTRNKYPTTGYYTQADARPSLSGPGIQRNVWAFPVGAKFSWDRQGGGVDGDQDFPDAFPFPDQVALGLLEREELNNLPWEWLSPKPGQATGGAPVYVSGPVSALATLAAHLAAEPQGPRPGTTIGLSVPWASVMTGRVWFVSAGGNDALAGDHPTRAKRTFKALEARLENRDTIRVRAGGPDRAVDASVIVAPGVNLRVEAYAPDGAPAPSEANQAHVFGTVILARNPQAPEGAPNPWGSITVAAEVDASEVEVRAEGWVDPNPDPPEDPPEENEPRRVRVILHLVYGKGSIWLDDPGTLPVTGETWHLPGHPDLAPVRILSREIFGDFNGQGWDLVLMVGVVLTNWTPPGPPELDIPPEGVPAEDSEEGAPGFEPDGPSGVS